MPRAGRDAVLGEVGKGYKVAIETLNEGPHRHRRADDRPRAAARSITRSATCKERKQFGKAIAEFQAVQHQLARLATEVEAARLLVYNAARLREDSVRS